MSSTWPLEWLTTVTFADHRGRTRLTLRGSPIHATEEELRTFEAGIESMQNGFGGTLDSLYCYLAGAKTE